MPILIIIGLIIAASVALSHLAPGKSPAQRLAEYNPDGTVTFRGPAPAADSLRTLALMAQLCLNGETDIPGRLKALAASLDLTDDGHSSHVPHDTFLSGMYAAVKAIESLPEDNADACALYQTVNAYPDVSFEEWTAKIIAFIKMYTE